MISKLPPRNAWNGLLLLRLFFPVRRTSARRRGTIELKLERRADHFLVLGFLIVRQGGQDFVDALFLQSGHVLIIFFSLAAAPAHARARNLPHFFNVVTVDRP